jgi:hypothetical protein
MDVRTALVRTTRGEGQLFFEVQSSCWNVPGLLSKKVATTVPCLQQTACFVN